MHSGWEDWSFWLSSPFCTCSVLGTGQMWFHYTVNLQYICIPFALFSSPQHAAWWLAGCSRHLQSRWCRSRAPFPSLYNSSAKYWVGQSAEPRISFLQKYEMCFPSTSTILSWFPSGASVNLIPSLCMLCLHTSLLPHYTLVDVGSAQTCLQRHFRDLMSYPVLLTAHSLLLCILCWCSIVKGNKEMFFFEGHWYYKTASHHQ